MNAGCVPSRTSNPVWRLWEQLPPEWRGPVIGDGIDDWLEISLHRDISSIFQGFGEDTPLRYESTSLDVLEGCARATPIEYVKSVLPILIDDWERTVYVDADWRPVGVPDSVPGLRTTKGMFSYGQRSLREEVVDALRLDD